jgi:tetratricopeptide (TPR) repeat protein
MVDGSPPVELGDVLAERGDLSGAVTAYEEALHLQEGANEGRAGIYSGLGSTRNLMGDLQGAIAAYRQAIKAEPDGALEARYSLGLALAESADTTGAIGVFHEAVQHEQLRRIAPFRLLQAMTMDGKPDIAVKALRRVRDQSRNDQEITAAIDRAIRQTEQIAKLGTPIPKLFRLHWLASNFAQLCYYRRFFAASAAIWSAGFATDPALAEDMEAQNRYNAACSAALAATGRGLEKPPLNENARAQCREQALAWLKADVAYWSKQAATDQPESKARVSRTLQHWKADSDLATVREQANLEKLPKEERKAWQTIWADVDGLLKKVGAP